MTKEVRCCVGEFHRDIIMESCEACNDHAICEGHTEYIVKYIDLIINSISYNR